jgi:hypothetical protein
MNRLLLPLSLLFVTLMSSTAFADHLYLFVNDGSGDNFGFIGRMNGHQLILQGGTAYEAFGYDTTYMPGSTVQTGGTLYLYFTTIWVDGVPTDFGFPQESSSFGINPLNPFFTLPTDGRDVTVGVQVYFTALGLDIVTGQTVQVSGSSTGRISYVFNPSTGLYSSGNYEQTPEPGTLGLVGIGIMGILSSARKRLQSRRIQSDP